MTSWRFSIIAAAIVMTTAPSPAAEDSILKKLLDMGGFTVAPSQLRSEALEPGSIWVTHLDHGGSRRLTVDSDYRSPIFSPGGESVFALKGDSLVRIPLKGGAPTVLQTIPGSVKLVGFDKKNHHEIILLLDRDRAPLATLSLKSKGIQTLTSNNPSVDLKRLLAQIRGQDRTYGNINIYLQTERKQGLLRPVEWTDIYLRQGNSTPKNISRCEEVSCSQPALSPDGKQVVFVKADESL